MTTIAVRPTRAPSPVALEIEALIARYPALSEHELDRLISIFPRLPILDVGLMTADQQLAPKLDAFHAAHGHRLRTPLSHIAIIFAVPVIYLLIAAWILLPT